MAGRQRTFELIPTTLVKATVQPQRMTSKQVKKAYQKKNKGLRVSRAEQHRRDTLELAQQKAGYERECASRKARAAREKKAAKEQEQRAERKRNGIPEPSKFVRASQPTISMFVKKGNKRSWQEIEGVVEDSEGTLCDQDRQSAQRVAIDNDSEDEFGDFPSFSQSNLPEILAKADNSLKAPGENSMSRSDDGLPKDESDLEPPPPLTDVDFVDDYLDDDEQELEDMITQQLLSEAAEVTKVVDSMSSSCPGIFIDNAAQRPQATCERMTCGRMKPMAKSEVSSRPKSRPFLNNSLSGTENYVTSAAASIRPSALKPEVCPLSALLDRSADMAPPALTNKATKSISFAAITIKPNGAALQTPFMPTSSATQAFIESNLDDFFPSPSQEMRELLEDSDEIPINAQVAKELDTDDSKQVDAFEDMVSTQDLILSPQDLLEIDNPSEAHPDQPEKCLIALDPQARQLTTRTRRRFFKEKEDDILHAALYESRNRAVREEPKLMLIKETPTQGGKILQRIQSTVTDYGDEDFNEQELLALL